MTKKKAVRHLSHDGRRLAVRFNKRQKLSPERLAKLLRIAFNGDISAISDIPPYAHLNLE